MSILEQLRETLEKQLAAADERLNVAQAKAKARKANAQADAVGAELKEEMLEKVNQLKDKIGEGSAYLAELAESSDERPKHIKTNEDQRVGTI